MSSGKPDSDAEPGVPPTMTSRPPRASQPRSAASCSVRELVRVDVLPDEAVERRPGLDPLRQVGDGRAGRRRARLLFWTAGRLDPDDDAAGSLGDDADDELGRRRGP